MDFPLGQVVFGLVALLLFSYYCNEQLLLSSNCCKCDLHNNNNNINNNNNNNKMCPSEMSESYTPNNTASLSIVVVGASGDLASKKIFPALFTLFSKGALPLHTNIVGYPFFNFYYFNLFFILSYEIAHSFSFFFIIFIITI